MNRRQFLSHLGKLALLPIVVPLTKLTGSIQPSNPYVQPGRVWGALVDEMVERHRSFNREFDKGAFQAKLQQIHAKMPIRCIRDPQGKLMVDYEHPTEPSSI